MGLSSRRVVLTRGVALASIGLTVVVLIFFDRRVVVLIGFFLCTGFFFVVGFIVIGLIVILIGFVGCTVLFLVVGFLLWTVVPHFLLQFPFRPLILFLCFLDGFASLNCASTINMNATSKNNILKFILSLKHDPKQTISQCRYVQLFIESLWIEFHPKIGIIHIPSSTHFISWNVWFFLNPGHFSNDRPLNGLFNLKIVDLEYF